MRCDGKAILALLGKPVAAFGLLYHSMTRNGIAMISLMEGLSSVHV